MSRIGARAVTTQRVDEFVRLFQSVRAWIETVLDVQLKNDIDQFLDGLKTGVVICYLMQEIDERSIPAIHEETSAGFKLRENVSFFLGALDDYGLPRHKRFNAADLVDEPGNIVKVVEALAELARSAEKKGFRIPFVVNERAQVKITDASRALLTSQLARLPAKPGARKIVKVSPLVMKTKIALLCQNGVNFDEVEAGFTKFQALVRGHLARNAFKKRKRDQAYRDHVAKEIFSTEKSYVDSLETCIKVYMEPLRKKKLIEKGDVDYIFGDMQTILALHIELRDDMAPRVANWHSQQCIGDIFEKIVGYLKLYSNYCSQYNESANRLHSLQKSKKKFEIWLETTKQTDPEAKDLSLESYLIMPVQRVPRYRMLLDDLSKHTWKSHPDYDTLINASTKIADVAAVLNEKKREAENRAKLIEMTQSMSKIKFDLALPHRRFLMEAMMRDQETVVFLFNDIILVATTMGMARLFSKMNLTKGLKYKDHWELKDLKFEDGEAHKATLTKTGHKRPVLKMEFETEYIKAEFHKLYTSAIGQYNEVLENKKMVSRSMDEKTGKSAEEKLAERRKARKSVRDASPITTGRSGSAGRSVSSSRLSSESDQQKQCNVEELEVVRSSFKLKLKTCEDRLKDKKLKKKDKKELLDEKTKLIATIEDLNYQIVAASGGGPVRASTSAHLRPPASELGEGSDDDSTGSVGRSSKKSKHKSTKKHRKSIFGLSSSDKDKLSAISADTAGPVPTIIPSGSGSGSGSSNRTSSSISSGSGSKLSGSGSVIGGGSANDEVVKVTFDGFPSCTSKFATLPRDTMASSALRTLKKKVECEDVHLVRMQAGKETSLSDSDKLANSGTYILRRTKKEGGDGEVKMGGDGEAVKTMADGPDADGKWTYDQLKGPIKPEGLDKTKLEVYLNDAEFKRLFNTDRDSFEKMPGWKKNRMKQELKMF